MGGMVVVGARGFEPPTPASRTQTCSRNDYEVNRRSY